MKNKLLTVMFASACALMSVDMASAKTCTWIGTDGSWSDAENWADGAIPEEGDDVFVPEGETVTISGVTGNCRKTGAGTMVIAGASDAECNLTVAEGVVRLAMTGNAKINGEVTVDDGATLVSDGDEQINEKKAVFLNGTWDLNGHAETIYRYYNTPLEDSYRDESHAAIVNRADGTAKLTVGAECAFYGRITEEPGRIEIETTDGLWNPFGTSGAAAPSKITARGNSTIFPYSRWTSFRFVIHETGTEGGVPQITDVQFTYKGTQVDSRNVSYSSSGTDPAHNLGSLVDNRSNTYWQPSESTADSTNLYFSIYYYNNEFPSVDGYRLGYNKEATAPKSWDVYVWRANPSGWFLVDRRRNENIVLNNFNGMMTSNYTFNAANRPRDVLSPDVELELIGNPVNNTRLRVASEEPMRVGKVSGDGDIQIENGSSFGAADMADWTGTFLFSNTNGFAGTAHILLSSERGGAAEQRVNVTANTANVVIENDGNAPVSVLVDDSLNGRLRGSLADGKGPLGLVKRGAGTAVLATANCSNTGVTSIESGCLKVCGYYDSGRQVSARYLRFHPLRNNNGNDPNGFNWGMNDFQLLDGEGNRIAFPSGTTVTAENGFPASSPGANLIDGNISNRCLVSNTDEEKTEKNGYCSWIVIDMTQSVSFNGYRWYTAHTNSADNNRVPVEWTLEVSDDGETWTVIDVGRESYNLQYGTGNTGFLRGPYGLRGEADGIHTMPTIPAGFFAEASLRDTRAPALKSRYFRFQPNETYSPEVDIYGYGWMISELSLFRNGERVDWPAGAKPTLYGGTLNNGNNSKLNNICNNVTTGELVQAQIERVFVQNIPSFVTIDAGEEVTFDAYGFFSGAMGGRDPRVPTAWTFAISFDGINWTTIDNQYNRRNIVKDEYAFQGCYSVAGRFPLLGESLATDSIGDESPVAVAEGAKLVIDSAYEKVGALSGSGTLEIRSLGVAELNAGVDGTFAGNVAGGGTLAVCGVATQTFDSAVMDVSKIEFNGATVAGTATCGGDVEVAFNGGNLAGTFAVTGALTVTGEPAFSLPADVPNGYRRTLFTYASIDDESAEKLCAARIQGDVPRGLKPKVRVGAKACVLSAMANGTILSFR